MDQHPVPQQISSYQFRLVGDMTLKQFLELAGGALVGLLFYASSLPGIIKWPLIIISVLFGAALAFLPLEDRPLEIWVLAFFRSIYSPTLFYWTKQPAKPQYFQQESGEIPLTGVIVPGGEAQLKKYLSAPPETKNPILARLEDTEKMFLSRVTGLFGQFMPQPQITTPPAPTPTTTASTIPAAAVLPTPIMPKKPAEDTKVTIPETQFIRVAPAEPEKRTTVKVFEEKRPVTMAQVAPTIQTQKDVTPAQQAQFSVAASPPMPPTQPNTVSGQVMDGSGRIIEAAILEIKDAAGRPVRAVKTNKLGHFFIVTPLADGVYEIISEKEGYEFETVKFTAEGKMIAPIAIKAK